MSNKSTENNKPDFKTWAIIISIIVVIGGSIAYSNISSENEIIENPKPGDYFVFSGITSASEQPFKLKEIKNDSLIFFIPKVEFVIFNNKSERRVYELDKDNQLYDPLPTIAIHKSQIPVYLKNAEIGERLKNQNQIMLTSTFSRKSDH